IQSVAYELFHLFSNHSSVSFCVLSKASSGVLLPVKAASTSVDKIVPGCEGDHGYLGVHGVFIASNTSGINSLSSILSKSAEALIAGISTTSSNRYFCVNYPVT